MTYCSEIMHQQTQKISELESEIQQLKQIISILKKNCEGTNKLYAEKYEQVEAAKTRMQNARKMVLDLRKQTPKSIAKGTLFLISELLKEPEG